MINKENKLVRVDRNGTKHWESHVCPKCGGSGEIPCYSHVEGGVCFLCMGTGSKLHKWVVRTPEYEIILAARRLKKLQKEIIGQRIAWLEWNNFNEEGFTWIAKGDTFSIKDELKEAGAKFNNILLWHFNHEYENSVKIHVLDFYVEILDGDGYDVSNDYIEEARDEKLGVAADSPSKYVGEVGKKIELNVTHDYTTGYDSQYGWTNIHSFKDDNENIIVWRTGLKLPEQFTTIKGTFRI